MVVLIITLAYFIATMLQPRLLVAGFAGTMSVVILVAGLWPEETARESMRKPWVAGQYVYSNQVIGRDVPGMDIQSQLPIIEKVGILKAHPFTPEHLREVSDGNIIQAGEFITMTYCSNCHSASESGIRPLHRYFPEGVTQDVMERYIRGAIVPGTIAYMPKMPMIESEIKAISAYLVMNNNQGMAATQQAIAQEIAHREATEMAQQTDLVVSMKTTAEENK
jgi:hypothetical protein